MPPTPYIYHTAMQEVRGIYRGRGGRGALFTQVASRQKVSPVRQKSVKLRSSYQCVWRHSHMASHRTRWGGLRFAEDPWNAFGCQSALNLALNGLSFWPSGPGLRPGIVPCSFAFGGQGLDWRFLRARPPRGPFP